MPPRSPDGPPTPVAAGLHPGLQPYAVLLAAVGGHDAGGPGGPGGAVAAASAGWIDRADAIAVRCGLRSAGGAPLRFEAGLGAGADALRYEAAIHDDGRIACRTVGRGEVHDLHNALVWLRFPQVKATLNRCHRQADRQRLAPESRGEGGPAAAGRGRLRDAITLLDESGLAWIGGDPALVEMLAQRRWVDLLVGERASRLSAVRPVVIGHGLLEKLHRPYKAMTAHCLPCPVDAGRPVACLPSRLVGAATDRGGGDVSDPSDPILAARIAQLADAGALTAARLLPLPVQGLPGWDPANADPSYYADRRVFRPAPRTGTTGA